jgi:hypothetical protein
MTTVRPKLLYLTWQDAFSRRIVPVGRLLKLEDGYEFAYIGASRRAEELGFEPLLSFPNLGTIYRSEKLPPLFSNRLMSASRKDLPNHLQRLALRVDENEPFTVLARSSGRRETDKLEVFSPPRLDGGKAEGLFLVRGVRHTPGADAALVDLRQGDKLYVAADVQNEVNPHALLLRDEQRRLLGFVPDYLAQEFGMHGYSPRALEVRVLKVNPHPAPVHHRILCTFEYASDPANPLFSDTDYEPLSAAATPVSATAA